MAERREEPLPADGANGLTPAPDGYPIKLVRDRTPAILNASGEPGDLFYGPLPHGERNRWLRLKLAEEVGEYLVDGGVNELRDVFVVVLELALEHGVDLDRMLEKVRSDPRGLFRDGVMMYGRHPEFDGKGDPLIEEPLDRRPLGRGSLAMPDPPEEVWEGTPE